MTRAQFLTSPNGTLSAFIMLAEISTSPASEQSRIYKINYQRSYEGKGHTLDMEKS